MEKPGHLQRRLLLMTGLLFVAVNLFAGCGIKKQETQKAEKRSFTVVEELAIPEELKARLTERKEREFQLSFATGEELYLAVGYGEQPTSGYSIVVERLEETEEAIYFETNLIGPDKEEKIVEKPSYPYLVIKTEFSEKDIYYE